MSKIYLFDLFDTILNDLSCDFDAGLKIFWERHFADRCSFEDISAYGVEMYNYLHQVQSTGTEFCFATDEVPMYCKKYGVEPFALSEEEEWQMIYAVGKEEFREDTKSLLDRLEAVWLNAKGEANVDNLPIRIITKMSELL